jgi:sulfite exporter TauE/SafE
MTAAAVAAAFAMGLLGGFGHCLAMCGPLVGSFALAAGPLGARRALAGQLVYHAGRVTTYALVGGTLGATGAFLDLAGRLAGIQGAVSIGAGVLMVALGLGAAGVTRALRRLEAGASARFVAVVRSLLAPGGGAGRLYPLGLALGFLPCGLSLQAFLAAAGTGTPAAGLLVALAFGVGTVPALLVAGWAGAALGARARGLLLRAGGAVVAVLGVLFVARGLGLHAGL